MRHLKFFLLSPLRRRGEGASENSWKNPLSHMRYICGWPPRVIFQYVLQTWLSRVYPSHHNRKNCTIHLYIYPLQTLNLKVHNLWIKKTLVSFIWLLIAIWDLKKIKIPLKDFLNLVLVCKEIFLTYGHNRI